MGLDILLFRQPNQEQHGVLLEWLPLGRHDSTGAGRKVVKESPYTLLVGM